MSVGSEVLVKVAFNKFLQRFTKAFLLVEVLFIMPLDTSAGMTESGTYSKTGCLHHDVQILTSIGLFSAQK